MLRVNNLADEPHLPRFPGFVAECLKCGVLLPTSPGWTTNCRCGNLGFDVDAGRTAINEREKVVWYAINWDAPPGGEAAAVRFFDLGSEPVTNPDRTLAQCPKCRSLVACGDPNYTACRCDSLVGNRGTLVSKSGEAVTLGEVAAVDVDRLSQLSMRVRLSNGAELSSPTEADILRIAALLRSSVNFVVIERSEQDFMQSRRAKRGFELQIKAGSPQAHYEWERPRTLEEVTEQLLGYVSDPTWVARVLAQPGWRPVKLEARSGADRPKRSPPRSN